jgi:hypothetical protein
VVSLIHSFLYVSTKFLVPGLSFIWVHIFMAMYISMAGAAVVLMTARSPSRARLMV